MAAVKNSDNKTSNHNNNVTKNSIVAGNNNFNSISPPENVKRAVELGKQIYCKFIFIYVYFQLVALCTFIKFHRNYSDVL